MNLAIDIHGTIDHDPEFWRKFMRFATEFLDIRVYILSGPEEEKIHDRLKGLHVYEGVHYAETLSVADHIMDKIPSQEWWRDGRGNFWTKDENWWPAKAEICREYNIDILIDNDFKYAVYITKDDKTRFVLYSPRQPLLFQNYLP